MNGGRNPTMAAAILTAIVPSISTNGIGIPSFYLTTTTALTILNAVAAAISIIVSAAFANVPNWKTKVWVLNSNGAKIKLGETCLLRCYKGDEYVRPHNQVSHRDEFLVCTSCNKVRRFELKSREDGHANTWKKGAQDDIVDAASNQIAEAASTVCVLDAICAGLRIVDVEHALSSLQIT
ncbi:hypothetical protein E3N88_26152 [Mikania micrantha]|uniref:ULTRAPETALA1/2 SAND domain-containing protein n=1 Tax=Mikania micrantha TaxID=192012 RepID=A0A5N6N8J0_9ASTR|nr:hypothetical protein E3N88_26152 [Mikania micrantha]